jgi:PAS domain S-box-containing protein
MGEVRKSIAVSDEKYKSFIENAGLSIVVFDRCGTHLDVNPAFCGVTGFEKKELIGTNFPSLYWPEHFARELENGMQQLIKTGFLKTESYFRKKNETIFPVSLAGSLVQDQKERSAEFILLVQDITDIKRAERERKLTQEMLIATNKNLERKVKEKTAEIKLLLKQKDEFIKMLSHDLKNPLNPLINLIPILEKKITDPDCQKILSVIHENAVYMQNLVVNTIKLAKLDSLNVAFNFEEVNLREMAESVLERNKLLFQENNIAVKNELHRDIRVQVDKLRFYELFDNVLSNSVKYSPDGGTIVINSEKQNNGFVQISIKDEGIGMTREQLEHMFDDFYKADPSRHDFSSSGLGMSICKRIVENHGGQIWAESPGLGKGTAMFFNLPVDGKEEDIEQTK